MNENRNKIFRRTKVNLCRGCIYFFRADFKLNKMPMEKRYFVVDHIDAQLIKIFNLGKIFGFTDKHPKNHMRFGFPRSFFYEYLR